MANRTKIGTYYDAEEKVLIESIESDDYLVGKSFLTDKRRAELQEMAKNTNIDERQKNSLLSVKGANKRSGLYKSTEDIDQHISNLRDEWK